MAFPFLKRSLRGHCNGRRAPNPFKKHCLISDNPEAAITVPDFATNAQWSNMESPASYYGCCIYNGIMERIWELSEDFGHAIPPENSGKDWLSVWGHIIIVSFNLSLLQYGMCVCVCVLSVYLFLSCSLLISLVCTINSFSNLLVEREFSSSWISSLDVWFRTCHDKKHTYTIDHDSTYYILVMVLRANIMHMCNF